MNLNPHIPNYIAKYCDQVMTKDIRGLASEKVDEKLDQIIRLFCCLHQRDLFVKSYQQYLCSRLLNKTMTDKAAEENMLSKLKMELGINAVNKMTTMFKDIGLSETFTSEFKANKSNTIGDFEISTVNVLTNGNWPIDEQLPCKVPRQLEDMQAKFKRYYDQKFNNRQLKWLYQYGTVEINAITDSKTYFVTVNIF